MKRYIYLLGISLVLCASCQEDDGLTTQIQKVARINFELNTTNDLNGEGELSSVKNINLTQKEFFAYEGQIKDFQINRVAFSIRGLDEDNSDFARNSRLNELRLSMRSMGQPGFRNFFSVGQVPFGRTETFEIYKRDSTHNVDVERAISVIRTQLLTAENSVWNLEGGVDGVGANTDFEIELLIDINAVVGLR